MSHAVNARIPPRVEQKLADCCASGYSLAAGLIPPEGVTALQSANIRKLARKAFRRSRGR